MTEPRADGPRVLRMLPKMPRAPRSGIDLRHWEQLHVLAARLPTAVFALTGDAPELPTPITYRRTTDESTTRSVTGADAAGLLRGGGQADDLRWSETTVQELLDFVATFEPEVIVVGPTELGRYVEVLRDATDVPIVFDLHETQGDVLAEISAVDAHRGRALLARLAARSRTDLEARAVAAADQVWMSSGEEVANLEAAYPAAAAAAVVVPNTVDVDSYPRAVRADPRALVYPGWFAYVPNEVAARTLVEEIVPLVADASLVLVGAGPTAWMRDLSDPRVTVTGTVPDVRPYLAGAGVMPVPLTAGGGTRLKILEAFSARLPVVSTRKGAEGLALVAGEHYVEAETPAEFATAVEQLAEDRDGTECLTERAFDVARSNFSRSALWARMTAAFDAALTGSRS